MAVARVWKSPVQGYKQYTQNKGFHGNFDLLGQILFTISKLLWKTLWDAILKEANEHPKFYNFSRSEFVLIP